MIVGFPQDYFFNQVYIDNFMERPAQSDLPRRLKTAFFIGLVVLGSLYLHPLIFLVVFGMIFFTLALEFFSLRDHFFLRERKSKRMHYCLAFLSIVPYLLGSLFYVIEAMPGAFPGTILLFALMSSIISIADMYGYSYSRLFHLPAWVSAIFYLGCHFALLPLIFFTLEVHYHFFAVLFTIWASDSGAYFLGRKFGKRKLFASLSPKKTYEGLIGGLLGGMLMMALLAHWLDLSIQNAIGLGFLIAAGVSVGDLVESRYKRLAGVKDSGILLPGHGGMYDRFDGLLFILPWLFIALIFWPHLFIGI